MKPPYHDTGERDAMRRFYTTHEAAGLLGVSLPTVVNWIKARRIRAHRTPGGHRRIAREDLAAFMLRQGIPLPRDLADAAPGRRKVLVIAEAGPAREGTARQLAAAGYAVEQVSPGFSAGVAAARFEPDVVVLLALEPHGGDVLRALRSDREFRELPVVGVGHADWVKELEAAGCAVGLPRPLANGVLARAVEVALQPGDGRDAPRTPRRPAHEPASGGLKGR
jgi:excisionase family DNA binding protein